MKSEEIALCGLPAVRSRFRRQPDSIVRLFFDRATAPQLGLICRALAGARKVYRQVEPAELAKIADSVHHGGVVAIVRVDPPRVATAGAAAQWARRGENLVVLDRIGNAHNLGALVRTAGFLGVPRVVISAESGSARPSPAAFRVAEGAMDAVELWTVPAIAPFLRTLAAQGFDVVGAATRGGSPSDLKAGAGPWALVLGNEESGMAPDVAAACGRLVTIAGGGQVESLNVSAAAAILMHELGRRPAARPRKVS
jgi:TrmH RNA methyltransferase